MSAAGSVVHGSQFTVEKVGAAPRSERGELACQAEGMARALFGMNPEL